MGTPDEILQGINDEMKRKSRGRLKIFFGMCAGVGKTYSMLLHARELIGLNKDVLVGYIETHGRADTARLLDGMQIIPRKKLIYRDIEFEEFDLEKALELKPEYILVDELAHTNVPGSKHNKRYQDVIELLENGINVLTTLNVQHIESRSKTVEQITGIQIHETVPDSLIEIAENVELIDLTVEELLARLQDGKVYVPEKAKTAYSNFFKQGNLISLREMALRLTAEKVESDLVSYMSEKNITGPWKVGDKLLVAVGTSPFSAELIRWTRRMAYSLKTQWFAVHVKTDVKENEKSTLQLEKNLRLAKELGAEVVTTADTDLVDGLINFARNNNISQIIIGKPLRYNIFNYIKKNNYVDRLIAESGNIDIYIIRPSQVNQKVVKKPRIFSLTTPFREYAISALSVILLAAICFPLREHLGYQSIGLIFLLNLLIIPFYAGRGAIFLSAFLNMLIWNFFFIPPLFTFEINSLHDTLTLILNFFTALTAGLLVTRIKKQKQLVQIRESASLALLNYTKELSNCSGKYDAIRIALKHIDENVNANATFFNIKAEALMSSRELYDFEEKDLAILKWSLMNNKIAGKFTDNLPSAVGQFFPVVSKKTNIGAICLLINHKLYIEQENLVTSIIEQLASVYEREDAEEKVKKLMIETESKRLYDTLLDSISHEFRTPLSVIIGSATSLLEDGFNDKPELVKIFAAEIYTASKRLDLLVGNLLDISRLESGSYNLHKENHNLLELINSVLDQLADLSHAHTILIDSETGEAEVSVDYGIFSQALFNILHNSLVYTPEGSTIKIKTQENEDSTTIQIIDDGPGLSQEVIDRLFEKFYRPPGTKTGGTGLGLSIAKGFIEAHGGSIGVENNLPSGLIFDITLPG